MAFSFIDGIAIRGICSVLPETSESNHDFIENVSPDDVNKIIDSTGIKTRKIACNGVTALDLAKQACEQLLNQLAWQDEKPELIIMVTQSPDNVLPGNAVLIQHHLACPKTTIAFDVNLGCSGFVYGLWQISQLLLGLESKRALLIVGDTSSAMCAHDYSVKMLFGDAVAAIALEKDPNAEQMAFDLGTDGSGAPYLIQPYGAAKVPDHKPELKMNGIQVFAFTLREIPQSVTQVMTKKGWQLSDVDFYIFHQANKMMLKHLAEKMKLPEQKMLITMEDTGNTSSASIPLAITKSIPEAQTIAGINIVLSGFGAGWSWGSACLRLANTTLSHQFYKQ